MKKHTGSSNKYNHPLNNLKPKSILSIFAIGIFIFFGFASIDAGDPETRLLNDCEFLHPPVALAQKCTFTAYDETGMPLDLLIVTFFIREYEKVGDKNQCSLVFKNAYTKTLRLDKTTSGKESFTLSKSYLSNEDEIEISFTPSQAGYQVFPRTLRLQKSDKGIDYEIHMFKIEQYP